MVLLCCLRENNFQKLQLLLPEYVLAENTHQLSTEVIHTVLPDLLVIEASSYNHEEMLKITCPDFISNILLWGEKDDGLKEIITLVTKGLNYLYHPVCKDQLSEYLITKSLTKQSSGQKDYSDTGIIGNSNSMQQIRKDVKLYGQNNDVITITGETGTGKEITARALHRDSKRSGPFIPVNCAAIPESILESEMFGSVKGAYTDSTNRMGYFEAAQGGTLFLDEIGDLPLFSQSKLLRILEDKQLTRLGSTRVYDLDVRIICATSKNLRQMMEEGSFRSDLYYRLNILKIEIPPLRQRKQDIPLLCQYLMEKDKSCKKIHPEAMMKLLNHSWPGNVRELKSILRKAEIISQDDNEIKKNHIEFF